MNFHFLVISISSTANLNVKNTSFPLWYGNHVNLCVLSVGLWVYNQPVCISYFRNGFIHLTRLVETKRFDKFRTRNSLPPQ
jgi:hypothetical protein